MKASEAKGMSEAEILARLDAEAVKSRLEWLSEATTDDLVGYGLGGGFSLTLATREFQRRGLEVPPELEVGRRFWTGHEWKVLA